MKKTSFVLFIAFLLILSAALSYASPSRNVSSKRHPNIAAAQKLVRQAFEKIKIAQDKNEFDRDGHAQKAKELLDQANNELKQAAEAANDHHGKR